MLDVPPWVEDAAALGLSWVDAFDVLFDLICIHSTHFIVLFIILAIGMSKFSTLSTNGLK